MTTSSPDNSRSLPITQNLELVRQEYQYNYTHIPPIPMVNQLPNQENFTTRWTFLLAQQLREIFINTLITNRGDRSSKSVRDQVKRFILEALFKGAIPAKVSVIARLFQIIPQFLIQGISKDFHELDDLFFSLFKTNGLLIFRDSLNRITALLDKGHPTGHVNSLKDYQKLFTTIELPAIAKTFDQDQVFAYMQVAGYNPLVIKRVKSPGANFPVEDTHYQAVMGSDDSLAAAGQEGRLYLADYQILDGGIQTLDYLVDAATLIIFTASAQHAAVNFPQKDLMSYAPAFPLAGYVSASINGEVSEQDYLNLLPPLEQAQQQFNLLTLLGSIYYNQLGEYPKSHFANPKVQILLQKFQSRLQQIEITINQRNLHRPTYEYLLPSKIPQSINI